MAKTRKQIYLKAIAEGGSTNLKPVTREEMYYAAILGEGEAPAKGLTRKEQYLGKIGNSCAPIGTPGQASTEAEMESILANATDADIGKAYIYTGASTDTYEQGALYMITKEE